MARHPSPEIDDELFNEIYGKAYTGPAQSKTDTATQKEDANKRVLSSSHSDEEDKPRDPNDVPTDFTSREAKVWEAKAKATERNWKKRKEEEMICKICGESGHFTQGCPSTLGTSRKSADFFERIPARDKNVRVLFSEKVINQIVMDVGCKIKMDEKFLFVSGKDRLILAKGVEAVHKIIQDGRDRQKSLSKSNRNESRSPHGSPKSTHQRRSESQRSHSSPRSTSRLPSRSFNQERPAEEHKRQDPHKMSRSSPRAYPNDGGKDRQACSKSPLRPNFTPDTYRSYDGHHHFTGLHEDNSDLERQRTDPLPEHKFELRNYPQSLEEIEKEFKEEVVELSRLQAQEEDEENYKHRERMRHLREDYMKKQAAMRTEHLKQWEEFLQRRPQIQPPVYSQLSLAEYDQHSWNLQYVGSSLPVDSASRYQYPDDNYSVPRPHEGYSEFQLLRHEDFGNTPTAVINQYWVRR